MTASIDHSQYLTERTLFANTKVCCASATIFFSGAQSSRRHLVHCRHLPSTAVALSTVRSMLLRQSVCICASIIMASAGQAKREQPQLQPSSVWGRLTYPQTTRALPPFRPCLIPLLLTPPHLGDPNPVPCLVTCLITCWWGHL